MLTRRPVTLIHSTKGHDATNLANVHYSPGPEHENIPNPGVDYSPRGHPVHQGLSLKEAFKGQGQDFGPLVNPQQQQQQQGYGYTITKKFGVNIKHGGLSPRRSSSQESVH